MKPLDPDLRRDDEGWPGFGEGVYCAGSDAAQFLEQIRKSDWVTLESSDVDRHQEDAGSRCSSG